MRCSSGAAEPTWSARWPRGGQPGSWWPWRRWNGPGPVCDVLDAAGYPVDGTLLQSSRLARLPDGTHRLAATNPVFLLWDCADHDRGQ